MPSNPVNIVEGDYYEICEQLKFDGRKRFGGRGYDRIVFTNGCFDILHVGHLRLLDECHRLAGLKGAVVVGVNSNQSVSRLKGSNRPILDESERAQILIHLKCVDHVIVFEEDTPFKLIESLRPDLIVKGGDYKPEEVVGAELAPVIIVDLLEGVSTSKIVERIER